MNKICSCREQPQREGLTGSATDEDGFIRRTVKPSEDGRRNPRISHGLRPMRARWPTCADSAVVTQGELPLHHARVHSSGTGARAITSGEAAVVSWDQLPDSCASSAVVRTFGALDMQRRLLYACVAFSE